jgi:AcrR family transcriptional regulator
MVNQPSKPIQTNSRRRPGGRTGDVTQRIHEAILELLIEGGVQACTFSAVADRAKVQRSTLYRRFPDRWDAMIDAFMAQAAADVLPDLGDSFAHDLASVLRKLVQNLETPLGPALIAVATEYRAKSGGDYSRLYFDRRMEQLEPMFAAGISRGELPATLDREELFSFAAGPIYFRMFIAGRPADDDFINSIVSSVCWLFCSPSAAAKAGLPARLT